EEELDRGVAGRHEPQHPGGSAELPGDQGQNGDDEPKADGGDEQDEEKGHQRDVRLGPCHRCSLAPSRGWPAQSPTRRKDYPDAGGEGKVRIQSNTRIARRRAEVTDPSASKTRRGTGGRSATG